MLTVLITLTPGGRNEFIDCQKAKVPDRSSTYYGCENTLQADTVVIRACLPNA